MAVSSADKKKLGKWIKQAREKKQPHLSQRQLALAVDITNASLSSIESGMIFPSEELLLKLIEQLQPPPELREKMLALFAKAKGTSPPDINAELSKNPKLWGLIRQLIAVDPSEEQITQIEQLIYAGISASGGTTNVLHLNTLDYSRWGETTKQEDWIDTYNEGFKKLKKLQPAGVKDYSQFQFDLVMANPPFAGDIKENTIISHYELGKNSAGKWQNKVGRDVLFIERNLNFLKPSGRMAIVLPQGRFNNSSDKYIREFIAERCRILAVVGLHGNVFKPHTGTKTSVLFVQKWDDELCPKKEDYPIFFATMQKPSKDNSGEKIYVKDPITGENVLDRHGHLIVDHDLYSHDGLTPDGIAEAFIEFAKKEGLSFFQ